MSMKKLLLFTAFLALMVAAVPANAQRYLSEIFSSITVNQNIQYATNITVITGSPGLDTLTYDVYHPMGDTLAERPVVIVAHTGIFLPSPQNGQATGSKRDSAVVDMCRKLAKRGFVAIAMDYRFGWNPLGSTQDIRTGTLLNAAYRGIQDARTLVRYLRNDYANGNQHAINPNRIVVGGMGTGGYISLGAAYLDSYDEINLSKFLDGNGDSYVDTSLSGDVEGKWSRALNVSNYPNESSTIQFAFNMGGAVGDSTWIEAGEVPSAGVHVTSDPFAPYDYGAVIVPTTGQFVVNVSGTKGVQRYATSLAVNASYDTYTYVDPTSVQAATVNGGLNGLFPFFRPSMESAPWEYWDSTYWKNVPHPTLGNFHLAGLATNPDMGRAKSLAYIDSTLNFVVPRIVCALGMPGCTGATTGNVENISASEVSVFPNPSASFVNIRTNDAGNQLVAVTVTDLNGRQVKVAADLKSNSYQLDHADLTAGMYFLTVQTRKGVMTQKVLFN